MNKEINNFENKKKKFIMKDKILTIFKNNEMVSKIKDNSSILKESFDNNICNYLDGFNGITKELNHILGSCNLIVQNNEDSLKNIWKHFKQNVNHSDCSDPPSLSRGSKTNNRTSTPAKKKKNIKKFQKVKNEKKKKIIKDVNNGMWYLE